ncbi:site-specific recombinase XerC [Rhizobium sp. BK377]|jgi:site-specific recombinase XerC|nr:site-specific recombinase XerC [Rhizobium sp. BK377]
MVRRSQINAARTTWERHIGYTKAALIYKKTGNLRAVQILLGHTKLESTVRYLGMEIDDALRIAEQIEL